MASAASFGAGVLIQFGPGWALIALAVPLAGAAWVISRGLSNG